MNKNRIIILGVILSVLGTFTLLNMKEKDKKSETKVFLPESDSIKEIVITKNKEEFKISKKDNEWIMEKPELYKANQEKVEYLIKSITKMELKDIISENEEEYKIYGVDEEKGINIKFSNGSKIVEEGYVGKPAPGYLKSYLRKGKEVYIVDKVLSGIFDVNTDDLKDKKIVNFNEKDITEISIKKEKKTEIYAYKDNKWQNEGKEYKNITDYLSELKKINLNEFKKESEVKDKFKDENIEYEITIKYNDGKTDVLKLLKEENGYAVGSTTYNNLYFTIYKSTYESIKNFEFKTEEKKDN